MVTETAVGLEQVLSAQKTGGGDEEGPPAKRLKLDSANGSEEAHKDGSKCVCSPCKVLLHVRVCMYIGTSR